MSKGVIWAIQHIAFETLGGFQPVLERAGYEVRHIMAFDNLSIVRDGQALVVLGGPISANDEARYPFLSEELRLIERWLTIDRPLLGICLGAQLIARVLGGRVRPGVPEIGFAPVTLTSAGAGSLLAPYADDPLAFHWHAERIELPQQATLLASSAQCPTQAFKAGDRVLGVQFHPEAQLANIEAWLLGHTVELSQHGIDVNGLRRDAQTYADSHAQKTRAVAECWLSSQLQAIERTPRILE